MKVEIANPIYDVVFDQNNRTSDNHILNVREEDFPEKYRPLIRRLKQAAANPEVKKQMKAEDEVFDYMKTIERMAAYKAAHEERKKWEADIAKKNEELEAERKKSETTAHELEAERKKSDAIERENEALRLKLQQAGLL